MTEAPQFPPTPQAAPRKRKKWPWVLGVALLLIVIAVAAGRGGSTSTPPAAPTSAGGVAAGNELDSSVPAAPQASGSTAARPAAEKRTVVYKVTGSGRASSITYVTDGMTSSNQESDVKLPWQKTVTLPAGEAFQMVSLLAQGGGKGSITATILVDGQVVKEASAQGYGIANANQNIGTIGN